jgi:hypothetical protein
VVRHRSSRRPDGEGPVAASHTCGPSPASRAADCAVRGGSEDGHPYTESGRLPPARAHTPAWHRPAGDRRARQRPWQLRGLRIELAMSARSAGRVRAGRFLNHHQPQGRHWTGDLCPRGPCEAGAGPVPKLPASRRRTAGAGCSSPDPRATPGATMRPVAAQWSGVRSRPSASSAVPPGIRSPG